MKNLYGMDFTDSDYVKSTLMLMAFFLAIYVFLYNILKKKIGISPEYTCRIVTFMHGVTSCFIALYYVVLPAVGFTQKGETYHTVIIQVSNAKAGQKLFYIYKMIRVELIAFKDCVYLL